MNAKKSNSKIVFCISSAEIGGAEKQLCLLSKELFTRGINLEVWFLFKGGENIKILYKNNIPFKIFYLSKYNLNNLIRMIKIILNSKIYLIDTFLVKNILITSFLFKVFSPKTIRIGSIRGRNLQNSWKYNFLFKIAINSCHKIICNSNYLINYVISLSKARNKRVMSIPNGFQLTEPDENEIRVNEVRKIVVLSNFHKHKGQDKIINVLDEITVPTEVHFFGDGINLNYIKDLAGAKRSNHKFIFRGLLPGLSRKDLLNFDFAIHASSMEGTSNAILEELDANLPVVCFDIDGNSEYIIDGVNGFLIPYSNLELMKRRVEALILDDILLRNLKSKAKITLVGLDWRTIGDKYIVEFGIKPEK